MDTITNNGTTWGNEADKLNSNFTILDKPRLWSLVYENSAKVISEEDDQYAHEVHCSVYRGTAKTFLLAIYQSNKTGGEMDGGGKSILKIFEFSTLILLRTIEVFVNGEGIFPATGYRLAPKILIVGATARCFIGTDTGLYARDITIVDDIPDNWTLGDTYIFEMTMKDSGGNNVKVDVIPANIQAHLEYTLGDTYAGYVNLVPILRNLDKPISYSGSLYSILELDGQYTSTGKISCLLTSADNGDNWTLGNLINYTTSARSNYCESSLVLYGSTFFVITRTGSASNTVLSTTNQGSSWTALSVSLTTLATKPDAINYYKPDGTVGIVFAVNITDEIGYDTGSKRTTLVIYTTTDFVTITEIAKIITPSYVHYPCLLFYSGMFYVAYTKGVKLNTDDAYPTGYDRNTVVFTRIY